MSEILIRILAGFSAGLALLLLLRTSEWSTSVLDLWRAHGLGAVKREMAHQITFPRWAVRSGTLLQSASAMCFATLFYQGLVPVPASPEGRVLIAAGILCSIVSLGWRWHHFTARKAFSWIAILASFMVSVFFVLGGQFAWQ